MDTPSVGSIVHYEHNGFQTGPATLAAIITHLHEDGRVNLTVFHSTFEEHVWAASYSAEPRDGTWHWPA